MGERREGELGPGIRTKQTGAELRERGEGRKDKAAKAGEKGGKRKCHCCGLKIT